MNLSLTNCHGQCYDGVNNMAGRRSGVSTQIYNEDATCYLYSLLWAYTEPCCK